MTAEDPTRVANQLIWTLAQQCEPDDIVVVGVATPIAAAAAMVARALLYPDLTVIVAASVDPPAHDVAAPMLSADAVAKIAVGSLSQAEVLDQIQRGRITLQFISPAQVDGRGNLNTSRVPRATGTLRRLPGGLATADIAVLVGRLIAYRAQHTTRFLTAQVPFVTGAGHTHGTGWRRERGLPGKGVTAVVTDKGLLRWTEDRRAIRLVSVHEGATREEAVSGCGFPLEAPEAPPTTDPPPPEACALLDQVIDPHGVRRLEVRSGRRQALAALDALSAAPVTPPARHA